LLAVVTGQGVYVAGAHLRPQGAGDFTMAELAEGFKGAVRVAASAAGFGARTEDVVFALLD
jgi:hypothetical protein